MNKQGNFREQVAKASFWAAPSCAALGVCVQQPVWGVAAMVGVHAGLLAGTLLPGSSLFGKVVCRVDLDGWLLTIDDGPDPVDTPKLLELLDQLGWKALFFFVGEKAAKYPNLVKEVIACGHQVGNHSWSHPQRSWWRVTPRLAEEELRRCQDVLTQCAGVMPRWFRSPVGMSNPWVHAAARKLGLSIMGWSVRGFDGNYKRSLAEVEKVLVPNMRARGKGAIVLLHEGIGSRLYSVEELFSLVVENAGTAPLLPSEIDKFASLN